MLEAAQHADNCFATLTYSDEKLESVSLIPRHLTLFLKRFRKEFGKFRYYAVGEYGDVTERPHFHLALFGVPTCVWGRTRKERVSCCFHCDRMQRVWGYGKCDLGTLDPGSARYVSGYVTKKLTRPDDERLEGRHPEFSRMSTRPGIGAGMMDEVASQLMSLNLDTELDDVPAALTHGRQAWPLGQYLRRRLRTRIGRDEKAPLATIKKLEEKLLPLRQAAYASAPAGFKTFAFKGAVMDAGKQARVNQQARMKIRKQRKSI